MAVKTKTAVVSKKVSDIQLKNSDRWNFFLSQCAIEWSELSEESKDFFCGMGHQEYGHKELNKLIDEAMSNDTK